MAADPANHSTESGAGGHETAVTWSKIGVPSKTLENFVNMGRYAIETRTEYLAGTLGILSSQKYLFLAVISVSFCPSLQSSSLECHLCPLRVALLSVSFPLASQADTLTTTPYLATQEPFRNLVLLLSSSTFTRTAAIVSLGEQVTFIRSGVGLVTAAVVGFVLDGR